MSSISNAFLATLEDPPLETASPANEFKPVSDGVASVLLDLA